jgi:hypothetical protein
MPPCASMALSSDTNIYIMLSTGQLLAGMTFVHQSLDVFVHVVLLVQQLCYVCVVCTLIAFWY